MSFTKKEFVEAIQIALGGAGVTMDTRPLPPFIEKLIAPAINFVLTKSYYIQLQQGEGKKISGLFYAIYRLDVKKHPTEAEAWYVDLPVPAVAMVNDRQSVYVGPENDEENQFIPVDQIDVFCLKHYKRFLPSPTAQIEGPKMIKFKLMSSTVKKVKVKYIASADGLGDDDVLPIPAGMELEAIEAAKNFFLRDKAVPQDMNADNKTTP